MDLLIKELLKSGAQAVASKYLSPQLFALIFGEDAHYYGRQNGEDAYNPQRSAALEEVKRKDGSVSLWIGTRESGKSVGSYRQAEFFGRPTYGVSPEEKMPSWITPVHLKDVDKLPHRITLILQDLPAYMSNRDYQNGVVQTMERIVPMCRHERKWHLIFNTQSASQADKYILDADLAFMKPWGVFGEDLERPGIRRIYMHYVMPYFEGCSEEWMRKHAFMKSRTFVGGIAITKPAMSKELVLVAQQNPDTGTYEVTGEEEVDTRDNE